MGQPTSTVSFGIPITGSCHQERVSVREQQKGAKPGAEGDGQPYPHPPGPHFPKGAWT